MKRYKLRLIEYFCLVGIVLGLSAIYQPLPEPSCVSSNMSLESVLIPIVVIAIVIWIGVMLSDDMFNHEPKK